MDSYENKALKEMLEWKKKMLQEPSSFETASKSIQNKISSIIPLKVQETITETIKKMVKLVIEGSILTTKESPEKGTLYVREKLVKKYIDNYKKTAMLTGAGTGAGGLIIGMADFPILLSLKLKLLFQIASAYGYNVNSYKERLYILHIFEIAFSSDKKRKEVFEKISDWEAYAKYLPDNMELFDWRSFQQEYRDYIDIAKMLQLVPVIGAPVGAIANYKLVDKLGLTAMNAYRMRIFKPINN
ncbi:MAG: EcsC family protein [Solirubrobacterales bacterium]